jgi:GGDEF domain-containing protein
LLNGCGGEAESLTMTIAPNDHHLVSAPAGDLHDVAVTDATALLPTRDAVLDRLADQMAASDGRPTTLMIIGLLRRDDGWPTPAGVLAQVTTLLARSLRGDDWLGTSGPAEFVVLLSGPASAARTAATRLVTSVAALGIPGLTASAGIAPLAAGVAAGEVLRRATLSLTAARRVGAGTVIEYREPLS